MRIGREMQMIDVQLQGIVSILAQLLFHGVVRSSPLLLCPALKLSIWQQQWLHKNAFG